MNTHTITKEQLDKLVSGIQAEFPEQLNQANGGADRIRDSFYKPEMYEEQGLYALKDEGLKDFPEEVRQKIHEMIASLTSVD